MLLPRCWCRARRGRRGVGGAVPAARRSAPTLFDSRAGSPGVTGNPRALSDRGVRLRALRTALLNVGSNSRARSAGRLSPAASAINDVRDAGELHVYRGGIKLATLKSGSLQDQLAFSALEFLPISSLLASGTDAMRARLRPPAHEPPRETSDFEWTALVNTILCTINGVKEHGHGGTVLLVAPGAERSLPIRTKFDVDERTSMLTDRFVEFLNARHEAAAAQLERRRSQAKGRTVASASSATFVAEEDPPTRRISSAA